MAVRLFKEKTPPSEIPFSEKGCFSHGSFLQPPMHYCLKSVKPVIRFPCVQRSESPPSIECFFRNGTEFRGIFLRRPLFRLARKRGKRRAKGRKTNLPPSKKKRREDSKGILPRWRGAALFVTFSRAAREKVNRSPAAGRKLVVGRVLFIGMTANIYVEPPEALRKIFLRPWPFYITHSMVNLYDSFSMPALRRRSVSSRPRRRQSSTAPPGVTALPETAMRRGHISVAFFTPRVSASDTSAP